MYTVATLNVFLPKVVTDCKGILDSLKRSPALATGHKMALARTWTMVSRALDDDFTSAASLVRWMPSHESAFTLRSVCDSNGDQVTQLMWRANRLADILAKAAAGRDRLPVKFTRLVSTAGEWVRHQAAKLGTVTHAANNFVASFVADGGATVTKTLRDSTADRPRYATARKRKVPSVGAPAVVDAAPARPSDLADSFSSMATADDGRALQRRRVGRHATALASSAPGAARARQNKRRALCAAEELREAATEEAGVARWLAAASLHPRVGPPAAERLQGLHARLRAKFAANSTPTAVP